MPLTRDPQQKYENLIQHYVYETSQIFTFFDTVPPSHPLISSSLVPSTHTGWRTEQQSDILLLLHIWIISS